MYIATGQGTDNPRGQTLDVNRNLLSLRSLATSLKKISLKSDFIHFFFFFFFFFFTILFMCIAPEQGLTSLGDEIMMSTGTSCHFVHLLQVSKNLFEVWFYTIFSWFYTRIYSPGAGADSPRGQSFIVNRNVLSLYSFVASFKKMSLKSDFIQFFSWINTCI